MLDLYTWHTPNGHKVPILLAELALPYELHLVDLSKGEQKSEAFLALNPNGKIPALVDRDGPGAERVTLFESGAILEYLAERAGRLLPAAARERAEVKSWLYLQVGAIGPMFGQLGAFGRETPRNEKAFAKFFDEGKRLVGVLDRRLRDREWLAGSYSIADIAHYPWFAAIGKHQPQVLEGADHVEAWMKRMAARPAVQKGMDLKSATAQG
jgi:GST-like protein